MRCGSSKVPELDGLPYKLYQSIPVLFGDQPADVYMNWQQKVFIPKYVRRGVLKLVRNDANKDYVKDNVLDITLLNTELNVLSQVALESLKLVANDLVIGGRTIQNNIHIIQDTAERLNETGKGMVGGPFRLK